MTTGRINQVTKVPNLSRPQKQKRLKSVFSTEFRKKAWTYPRMHSIYERWRCGDWEPNSLRDKDIRSSANSQKRMYSLDIDICGTLVKAYKEQETCSHWAQIQFPRLVEVASRVFLSRANVPTPCSAHGGTSRLDVNQSQKVGWNNTPSSQGGLRKRYLARTLEVNWPGTTAIEVHAKPIALLRRQDCLNFYSNISLNVNYLFLFSIGWE